MWATKKEGARYQRALFYFPLLFFLLAVLLSQPVMATESCAADHFDERVRVSHVHDGDTVRLQDGRRLRLIGIDTPELGRDGGPDQPYAIAARDALRTLLAQQSELELRYDQDRQDVHGRTLAHAFLLDGTSVSAWLLKRGYATLLVVPPDIWNVACYQAAERRARTAREGIWSLPGYRPVSAEKLARTARGYHLIQGQVAHIGESAHSLWLDLQGGVAARIDKQDLGYFEAGMLRELQGKIVVVRGWVYLYQEQLQLRLRYPTDLEVVE